MEFGFVRETEKQALNEDTETRIIKTGLDVYLKYIFLNLVCSFVN